MNIALACICITWLNCWTLLSVSSVLPNQVGKLVRNWNFLGHESVSFIRCNVSLLRILVLGTHSALNFAPSLIINSMLPYELLTWGHYHCTLSSGLGQRAPIKCSCWLLNNVQKLITHKHALCLLYYLVSCFYAFFMKLLRKSYPIQYFRCCIKFFVTVDYVMHSCVVISVLYKMLVSLEA